MLSSAWLPDATDEDNVDEPQLADAMVPEQFLEVDMNNFYLPTPPESSELWQDNLLPTSLTCAKAPRPSAAQRRLYCPRCTKAFSRTDSLRRHEKLYCRNNRKNDQQQQQQAKQELEQQPASAPS